MNVSVRKVRLLFAAVLSMVLAAGAAVAHHSTARFDMQHTVSVTGTVTQFDWTNPHTFIFMEVMNSTTGTSE